MIRLPKKYLVDTNVPINANLAHNPTEIPEGLIDCVCACVEAIEQVVQNGGLVIDSINEIFDEYRNHLSLKGQPGIGDMFIKWVHDNRWSQKVDRVNITKNGNSYTQFPGHMGLIEFDNSDRKFIAVSNGHPDKPPILQATDSKWWGWKEALGEVGITVFFLCPDYIETKYDKKMNT